MVEEKRSFFLNYKFTAGFVLGGMFIQLLLIIASLILTEINPTLFDNILFNDSTGFKKKISDGIYNNCEEIPDTGNFTTPYLKSIALAIQKSVGSIEKVEKITISIWLNSDSKDLERTPEGSVIIKFAEKSDENKKLAREIKDYICRYVVRLKKENLKLSVLKDNDELEELKEI